MKKLLKKFAINLGIVFSIIMLTFLGVFAAFLPFIMVNILGNGPLGAVLGIIGCIGIITTIVTIIQICVNKYT